ncbi:MAG: hypothetical protein JWP57_4702 [Spirosoma sp.]|nr:hypothetical protein [Spirosoma sp.]
MINSKTERLDLVLEQIQIVRIGLNAIANNKLLKLSYAIADLTNYFDRTGNNRRYEDCVLLDNELRNCFLNQQDSKLQDRFANYLIDLLQNKFRLLDIHLSSIYDLYVEDAHTGQYKTREERILNENGFLCGSIDDLVRRWMHIIRKNVKTFAPELYKEHSYTLDRLLPVYDEQGDEIEHLNEQPQLTEPGVKNPKETPTKDQILLLNELGVFNLPAIKALTTENKGKLFAWLLNRNEKNVTECIRNCDPKHYQQAKDNPYIYENKVITVNQLLESVGFLKKL